MIDGPATPTSDEINDAIVALIRAWGSIADRTRLDTPNLSDPFLPDLDGDEECGCGGEDEDGNVSCNCAGDCTCSGCQHSEHARSRTCDVLDCAKPSRVRIIGWTMLPTSLRMDPDDLSSFQKVGTKAQDQHWSKYACGGEHAKEIIRIDAGYRTTPINYRTESFRYEPDYYDLRDAVGDQAPHLYALTETAYALTAVSKWIRRLTWRNSTHDLPNQWDSALSVRQVRAYAVRLLTLANRLDPDKLRGTDSEAV